MPIPASLFVEPLGRASKSIRSRFGLQRPAPVSSAAAEYHEAEEVERSRFRIAVATRPRSLEANQPRLRRVQGQRNVRRLFR